MKRYHELDFEGITIKVLSEYDSLCGKYIDEIPDFEENPIYTPSGKPLVSAVRDQCLFAMPKQADGEADCGSCKFYRTNHPGDLIGVCEKPRNEEKTVLERW